MSIFRHHPTMWGRRWYLGLNSVDADNSEPLDVIRHVDQTAEGWIPERHQKTLVPKYEGEEQIPPSLQEAILAFVLACAARRARGQTHVHNSMLVHVSRFKDVHARVFGQADEWLGNVKQALRYRTGSEDLFSRLRKIWIEDFEETSARIRVGSEPKLHSTTWAQVERELSTAAEKIQVQVVNSDLRDAIDYDGNSSQGLSIIAIGGDKLSRGLTLEGLSVSYFLRASRMYDTLMQMGRWFGYRPGYIDLCRLYTTPDLEFWFRHVATAAEELRERFDHMAMIGSTPDAYGLRIQSHDVLLVTAPNKMQHSRVFQVSFQGEAKIQTVLFNDEVSNARNASAVTSFLDRIGAPVTSGEARPQQSDYKVSGDRRIWKNVDGPQVAGLLGSLLFPDEAHDVNASRLSTYIREQLKAGELTDWTVAVLAGAGESLTFNGWTFRTIERAPLPREKDTGRYVVKTILSPRDETIDLTETEYTQALEETNRRRAQDPTKKPASVPDGPEIRRTRGKDPTRALLLLYPLSPNAAGLKFSVPIFEVVVSFPDSNSGRAASYQFNTVEQRIEPA